MFYLALALQGAALQGPALAQEQADCMNEMAARFEQSGESPSDVATAVLFACSPDEPTPTSTNIMGQLSRSEQRSAVNDMRSSFRRLIVFYVVNKRTCDKSKQCRPFTIPASKATEYLLSAAP